MSGEDPRTRQEWLETLREAKAADPNVMVVYGRGMKNMRWRFWPPGIVFDKPPKDLHGKY